jgi:hypothetical protein
LTREQQRLVLVAEASGLLLLDDQHALDRTLVDDRHTEEGVVALLAGLLDVLELRVVEGVLDVDRLRT